MGTVRVEDVYVSGHRYRRKLGWRCSRCGRKRRLGELRPPPMLRRFGHASARPSGTNLEILAMSVSPWPR